MIICDTEKCDGKGGCEFGSENVFEVELLLVAFAKKKDSAQDAKLSRPILDFWSRAHTHTHSQTQIATSENVSWSVNIIVMYSMGLATDELFLLFIHICITLGRSDDAAPTQR